MVNANDVANFTKPEIVPVYKYTAEIDITPQAAYRTWAELCAGFNNISEAMNETIQQYFFLCGNGFGANYVTGMAPQMTMAGVRVIGNAAQDYIFNQKYSLMSSRDTHFRITRTAENGEKHIISANVTFANLSDISGGTTDGSAISVEMRFNGAPYIGDAWKDAPTAFAVSQNLNNVTSSYTGNSALKDSPFTATLTAAPGFEIGTAVITMANVNITDTAYNDGVITIPKVTGPIMITALGVTATYTVTQNLTHATSSNPAQTAIHGTPFITELAPETGYNLNTVTVTMGGEDVTAEVYSGNTVTIDEVTGDIVITATATIQTFTITQTLTNITSSSSATAANYGAELVLTLTADTGYDMGVVTVTMGGLDITAEVYDEGSVDIPSVTGNIVITAAGVPETYGVTLNLTHVSSSNEATEATFGTAYTTTLTADDTYTLSTVTVEMGGEDITAAAYDSGTVTIASVSGAIGITATATE